MRAYLRAATAGVLGAAVAMAVGELIAGLAPGAPSLVVAVGDLIIALQPPGAKQFVVDLFGTADKVVLIGVVVGSGLLIASLVGILGRRSPMISGALFAGFGLLALLAALRSPLVVPSLAYATVGAAVVAGVVTMRSLLRAAEPGSAADGMPDWSRRRFLVVSAGVAGAAVGAAAVGRYLLDQSRTVDLAGLPRIPTPLDPAPPVPPGASLEVPGISPLLMPNDRFYRIDTRLVLPRVDASSWRLRVHGLVRREWVLGYAELLRLPLFEQRVTIACVSNEVGGDLVGNAKWTGVRLRTLLDYAEVDPAAGQIVGRDVDGWTAGFPTAYVLERGREAMVAVAMNDEPLPIAHGFPARLIVPGLFGYVSATKWLAEIELTTWEGFDGYWVPRGWAKEGPILTQSRIDVVRPSPGSVLAAGVAWAPDRGVRAVEVQLDDAPWQSARLATPLSPATWVQWQAVVPASSGPHLLRVRATDGNGEVQTDRVTPPPPDGARGHHTIPVSVP